MKINLENIRRIFVFLFALMVILQTNSVYDLYYYHPGLVNDALILVSFLIILISDKSVSIKCIYWIYIFAFYFLVFFLLNVVQGEYVGVYIKYVVLFVAMYLMFCIIPDYRCIFYNIENVVLILGGISLIFWLLGSIIGVLSPTFYMPVQWGGMHNVASYFGVYFESQVEWYFGLNLYRNTCVFSEAPMYAVNLLIACLIELYMKERPSKFKIALLALCMLSTISISGIVYFFIILVLKRINFSKLTIKGLFRFICTAIIIAVGIYIAYPIVAAKIEGSVSRQNDYVAGFKTWIQAPLFGTGFNDNTVLINNMSALRSYNKGFSNSIMRILAQSGVFLLLLYLLPFVYGLVSGVREKNEKWKVAIILGVIYCTLLCTYSANMLVFVAYAWSCMTTRKWGSQRLDKTVY